MIEEIYKLQSDIEKCILNAKAINPQSVEDFIASFLKASEEYPIIFRDTEAGDHPAAPHHEAHMFAARVAHMLTVETGIDWAEYCKAIKEL